MFNASLHKGPLSNQIKVELSVLMGDTQNIYSLAPSPLWRVQGILRVPCMVA